MVSQIKPYKRCKKCGALIVSGDLCEDCKPSSERLPDNCTGVIFTVDRWHPFVCVGYHINSEREGLKLKRWFDKLSGLNFSDYDVKAWMPMPDAYEPPEKE